MRSDRLAWAKTLPMESRWLPTIAMVEEHSTACRQDARRQRVPARTFPHRVAERQRAAAAWFAAGLCGFIAGATVAAAVVYALLLR